VNVTAIILAAGGSARLGKPKQLISFRGRSLLRRAAETACASRAGEVIAVLGYEAAAMRRELHGLRVRVLENPLWGEGIASSVRRAVSALDPACDGALLVVCDQPGLTAAHLDALIEGCRRAPGRAGASAYGGSVGVPALFPRAFFAELLLLEGDRGAQRVLLAHREDLVALPWPDGEIDVDTPEDLPVRL
jgi:molybdenum cofactor cytidylyltransferase